MATIKEHLRSAQMHIDTAEKALAEVVDIDEWPYISHPGVQAVTMYVGIANAHLRMAEAMRLGNPIQRVDVD